MEFVGSDLTGLLYLKYVEKNMEIVIFLVVLRNQKKNANHILYSEEYSDFFLH